METESPLAWQTFVSFVRQYTHDLRNHLNGLELEAALLAEVVEDPEGVQSVGRLRNQIRTVAGNLRTLSGKFSEPSPNLSALAAQELFLIWEDQAKALGSRGPKVTWNNELSGEKINVDAAAVADVLKELMVNAFVHGSDRTVTARAFYEEGAVHYELRQKSVEPIDPQHWGAVPFKSSRRGSYGLGLWEARRLIAANRGKISHRFDQERSELVSRISFPTL